MVSVLDETTTGGGPTDAGGAIQAALAEVSRALGAVVEVPVFGTPDATLVETARQALRAQAAVAELAGRLVAEADSRGVAVGLGHSSTTSWLADLRSSRGRRPPARSGRPGRSSARVASRRGEPGPRVGSTPTRQG